MSPIQALIIGGGISGLGCARRLCDASCDFRLVTDRLGGRMHHSPDGSMNFGAAYINADYRHVSRYVARSIPFRLREAYCQQNGSLTTLLHRRNLRYARPILRLVWRLWGLRHELRSFRREAERVPQKELVSRYPLMDRYRRQSSEELIRELGLEALDADYFKLAFQATLFTNPANANALFYLGNLFPVIVPTWVADFTHTYDLLTAGYREKIHLDKVTGLRRVAAGMWEATTAGGRVYHAHNVILAVPYHNASPLYPVPRPHLLTAATMLYVRGRRRPAYRGKRFLLLLHEGTGVALIWQQGEKDQVYSLRKDPDLTPLYESPEVLGSVSWKTALVVSDADWVPLVLEPSLYLVGDYNICGLEDSFITGLCAANHILQRAASGRS